jgi:hypothetical protein
LATTTISVYHQAEPEPGEGITATLYQSGVAAVIAAPSGSELPAPGGGAERVDAILLCNPVTALTHTDRVTDADGNAYEVAWVAQREGFGLEHTTAGLVTKAGH